MKKRNVLSSTIAILLLSASGTAAFAADQLNVLAWCNNSDPALLKPFEDAHNVKVNVKEIDGTGAQLSVLEQSQPGDWDVIAVDTIDVRRMLDRNLLAELPVAELPIADQFPETVMADLNGRDGKTYGITGDYGYNTISFDKTKVDPADMEDMSILWSGKYAGKIAIYDYYLPIIGMTGLGLGIPTKDITDQNLPAIGEKLAAMKKDTKMVGDVVSSQTALATGEVDILVGGGEWITGVLSADKPNLDWTIPKQGALRWSISWAMHKDTKNAKLATEFLKYVTGPEGQAKLATSACFWSMPTNMKTAQFLNDAQKKALRLDQQANYLKNSQLYPAPSEELDKKFQDLWTSVLQK